MKIYFDMDGVLADWDGMAKMYGVRRYDQIFDGDEPDSIKKQIVQNRWRIIEQIDGFWEDMVVMPGTFRMLDIASKIGDLAVLTKMPRPEMFKGGIKYARHIRNAKREWIAKHLGEWFARSDVFVVSGRNKAKLLGIDMRGDVLVDDMQFNINDWNAAGGIGILHTDVASTISQLERLKSR